MTFRILRRTFYMRMSDFEYFAYTPLDDTVSFLERNPPGLPGSAGDSIFPLPVHLPTHSGCRGHNSEAVWRRRWMALFMEVENLLIICIGYRVVPCGPETAREH